LKCFLLSDFLFLFLVILFHSLPLYLSLITKKERKKEKSFLFFFFFFFFFFLLLAPSLLVLVRQVLGLSHESKQTKEFRFGGLKLLPSLREILSLNNQAKSKKKGLPPRNGG